jgi:hypothetical protein
MPVSNHSTNVTTTDENHAQNDNSNARDDKTNAQNGYSNNCWKNYINVTHHATEYQTVLCFF